MFNDFEVMKIKLKYVRSIFMRICKSLSRKPCINRAYTSKSSYFSYTYIVVTRTIKFLSVITPPYIIMVAPIRRSSIIIISHGST